jgi:hypothetical protein
MDYHFAVKFKDSEELYILFDNNALAKDYIGLFYRNYLKQLPILRDQGAYDTDKMRELASKAQSILGWDWVHADYDNYEVTTQMHKDLETYLKKGFAGVPQYHDSLLHELHICLHSAQLQNQRTTVQLEWFNDDGFDINGYDFKFIHDNTLGAISLQNPYVGHPPDWIWQQNDHTAVWQTCKFHDFVRPGLVISMQGQLQHTVTEFKEADEYLTWWRQAAPDFLQYHGENKMLANTGKPVIGYIINNHDLIPLQKKDKLIFEYVKFHPDLEHNISLQNLPVLYPISESDYKNLAGLDWPEYQEFVSGQHQPDFVCQEILHMTGIEIKRTV